MSNVLISNLPLYTGDTTGAYLVMNNSSQNTTYKVTKETLIGASGTSGTSGVSGTSGTSGVSGTSGTSNLGYYLTSNTSVTIGDSVPSFTTNIDGEGNGLENGQLIRVYDANNPSNYIQGTILVLIGTLLQITSEETGGSGTISNWIISSFGISGTSGTSGTSGVSPTVTGSTDQVLTSDGNGGINAESNLTFDGTTLKVPMIESTNSSGFEGGEMKLNKPVTGTTINSGIIFDVYQDKVRIFESGGANRGGYFDISTLRPGVGSNLGGIPTWTSSGTIQSVGWSGTTTVPTVGSTLINNISYRQIGFKQWQIAMAFDKLAGQGAIAGSGDYVFTLPNSLQFDTTVPWQSQYQGGVGVNDTSFAKFTIPGGGGMIGDGAGSSATTFTPVIWDSTKFRILVHIPGSSITCMGSGLFPVTSSIGFTLLFSFQSVS